MNIHDGNPDVSDEEGFEMPESNNDTPTGKVVKMSRIDDKPSDALYNHKNCYKFTTFPKNATPIDCLNDLCTKECFLQNSPEPTFELIEKFIPPRNITCNDCMAQPNKLYSDFYKYMKKNWCYCCDGDHDSICNHDNPHCIAFVFKYARRILYWTPDKLIKKANNFFSEWEHYKGLLLGDKYAE